MKGKKLKRVKNIFRNWRSMLALWFFISLYGMLLAHMYSVQVENGGYYSAKAETQYRSLGYLSARRGNIYFQDKNKTLVQAAEMKQIPSVYAVPSEIEDPELVAQSLLELLEGFSHEELVFILSKSNDPYEPLVKKAPEDVVEAIYKLGLPGIYVEGELTRSYPNNNIASHVLGYVGPSSKDNEIRGRYGVELFYEEELQGESGYLGDDNLVVVPDNGVDIVLTLDYTIQRRAEQILIDLVDKYSAQGGTVIVQDPKTGAILAMANNPSFNPNDYSDFDVDVFLNDAVESLYEPGSIFKVITMAIGIDSDKLTPDTTYIDKGSVTLDGRTIKNWDLKTRGELTMTEVLENSVNTGAVFAQRKIGKDIFYNYMLKFGFDELTGVDMPGEVSGSIKNLLTDRDINFATASFGQGISVTPISLINSLSAIANNGVMMRPYIVDRKIYSEFHEEKIKPRQMRRVISELTAQQVIDMMVNAVRKNYVADIPSYEVAGKTGTAQIPNLNYGGYYKDKVNNTYVGFAPATNPKFVILVKLNDPAGAPLAGLTVVPAFRELAEFLLNYYQTPPDSL